MKNEGQTTARNFSIEAELFDKDKKFVDVCLESFYSLTVKPGEERKLRLERSAARVKLTHEKVKKLKADLTSLVYF